MKCNPSLSFADQTTECRMYVREVVDDLGGSVECYSGGVSVAMPNDHRQQLLIAVLAELGLRRIEREYCYFPLGTDNYPDHQRHAVPGKYNGARGFAKLVQFDCQPQEVEVQS